MIYIHFNSILTYLTLLLLLSPLSLEPERKIAVTPAPTPALNFPASPVPNPNPNILAPVWNKPTNTFWDFRNGSIIIVDFPPILRLVELHDMT